MRFAPLACGLAIGVSLLLLGAPGSHAQAKTQVGAAPACPYGYYDYSPYNCAPYGYFGPKWFPHGIFRGAGPWFQGPKDFRGQVDDRFDVRHGYHGRLPSQGDRVKRHAIYDFVASGTTDGHGNYRALRKVSGDSDENLAERQ